MLQMIPMVDLRAQYIRYKDELNSAVTETMLNADYIQGKNVRIFEQELAEILNVKHVISCANGTDALQIAFMSLQLPQGSEVLMPSFAYAALAEVLHLLGLVPVFIDVNSEGYLMDVNSLESKITSKTKAIAPVHLFGECADMATILEVANKHQLFVVEDTAQAIGAIYCGAGISGFAGTLGHIGTTSFFPSKNLGCFGDGGAIFTNDDILAKKIRMIANHGQSEKYIHDIVGMNSRLDTIQASILLVKLKYLKEFTIARQKVADRYCDGLADLEGVIVPHKNQFSTHVYHQFTLTMKNEGMRNSLKNHLIQAGISTMVYYLIPLHKQKAYSTQEVLPLSENLSKCVLSLPICPELTIDNQQYIIQKIREFTLNYKNN